MAQAIHSSPTTPSNGTLNINHTQVAPQESLNHQQNPSEQHQKELAVMANTTTTHPPPTPAPHDATIATTTTTTTPKRTTAERTPQSPINGPKHGFLSLLFCCASDTSAWVDQGLSKQTPTLTIPSTKSGPVTNSQLQQQQQPHHLQGRSKRKKKHWFSRFYTAKQPTSQQQQQQQRQVQQQPTLFSTPSNDTSQDHDNDNNTNLLSRPPPSVTPNEEKTKNESPPPTPTTPTTSPPMTMPPTTTDINIDSAATTTGAFETTENPPMTWLLPPISDEHTGRKCLVLDLDETLVHSSFKIIPNPDFVVPVEIDQQIHNVYVLKRPGVDEFMRKMGEIYEIVIFTASLSKYADAVLDSLDIHQVVKHRLFRESCFNHKGSYVKDLSQLGRDLASTLILDNSPTSYLFHPANAAPVSTWFSDPHDTELTDLIDFLDDLAYVDDVTLILDSALHPPPSPMTTN